MAKIFCLTWNQELELPKEGTLAEISNRVTHLDPDLIVIGLQEAATYATFKSKFLAHELRRDSYLGKNYKKFEGSGSFSGVTKKEQILGSKAHQAIQVMVRKNDVKTTATMTPYQKTSGSEKGFSLAEVNFMGKKLAFVSTHLAVKEKNRTKELAKISGVVSKIPYDALFLMGDLNYRLYNDKRRDELLDACATQDGRAGLISSKHDSFNPEHFKDLSLTFPAFHAVHSLPTYKRKKTSKKGAADGIKKLVGGNVDKKALEDIYFPNPLTEKDKKFWDFGWLDRIGYNLLNGLSLRGKAQDYTMEVWSDMPYGDHAPVTLLLEIDGFKA